MFFWPVVRSDGGEESSESVQHVLCPGKAQDPTQPPAHPRQSQRVPPRSSNLNTFTAHESALGAAVSGSPGYLPVDLSIECITFAHVNITRISGRKMARAVRPQRLTP